MNLRTSLLVIGVATPLLAACDDADDPSSSSSTDASSASAASSSGAGGADLKECGDAPYVEVSTTVVAYPSNAPVAGAVFTADTCPGVEVVTDAAGGAAVRVTGGAPTNVKIEAAGFLPMRVSEESYDADFVGAGLLYPTAVIPLLPHWSDATPTILARVFTKPTASPPCVDLTGYTYAVVGHPEAIITYYSGSDSPTPDPMLTATGPTGAAEIAGLGATAPGAFIELEAVKAGCTVSFASYPHTGRHILEAGVLTAASAIVE